MPINRRGFWKALTFQLFPGRPTPQVTPGPIVVTLPFMNAVQVRIGGIVQDVALHPSLTLIPGDSSHPPQLASVLPTIWPPNAIMGSGWSVTEVAGVSRVDVDWTQAPK